jgi:hypothetical protein
MFPNSKDAIKSRMIRNASGIWGYSETEDINSFDPIVGMIIGALAEELYNISGEIRTTDARIAEKLFDLLISQDIFTHFPAHAILRAKPTQPKVILSDKYQFNYIKKLTKTINEETTFTNKNIFFTPTCELTLFNGEISYLATGNQIYKISDHTKEPLANSYIDSIPDFSKLYIGLTIDSLIDKLDGLSLMFSIKNKEEEDRFYSLISNARWKINNVNASFRQGFEMPLDQSQQGNLWEIFRNESNISHKTCNYVNEFYRSKYMMIENHNYSLKNLMKSIAVPEEIKRMFSANIIESIPGNILWIEIQLSQPLKPDLINELTISMNCFPVVNRELNEFSQLLTKGINIIPLATDDMFFSVKMISDSKGTIYKPLNSFSSESANEDYYVLRQGGIARFDSRNAKEAINHLIDLIRDERASFALLGADLISSEIKQLDQIISRLEQRLETSNITDDTNSYLLLNCTSNYERATIQFWSTSGELANNIRSDSRLTVHSGSDLDSNSVFMLTNSFGGRPKLTKEDKLNKLRRALLSKGRIVTMEDIKALCFEHFGISLADVDIKKGILLDPSAGKGTVRSLDIFLTLNKQTKLTDKELEQKSEELKVRLKQESINLLPYRIYIQK